jgi:hypothetical protein
MKGLLYLTFIIISLAFTACGPKEENKHLTYQNIVIISDMSSRIRNPRFPQKDIAEIRKIVQFFKDECVKPGKKMADKSSISISAFSEKTAMNIDIDAIGSLADKQEFVNSTGKYVNCGLSEKLIEFEDTVKSLYARINNPGMDLISLLIEKIENEPIIKKDTHLTSGVDTTFIHYENHIYIFTDGYLETEDAMKAINNQYYFGSKEIKNVRKYCTNNKIDSVSIALAREESLRLESKFCKTDKNEFVNLHIMETHERDKYSTVYKNPKGLRDNEILEAVWRKWATESGFKSFEWKKY